MTKVTIHYTPQNHNGNENTENSIFRYVIETDEPFENRSNGEKFAGIGGKCVETGEHKGSGLLGRVTPYLAKTPPFLKVDISLECRVTGGW